LRYIVLVVRIWPRILPAVFLLATLSFFGCSRGRGRGHEVAYISAAQVVLRDRVAPVYTKTGTVKNGERVQILERDRRFARIRTGDGAEGWIEERHLVTPQVFEGFQKLVQQETDDPVQAAAVTRNETNLHLTPGRETDHLYQLAQGAKVSILRRATAEKVLPGAPVREGENAAPTEPVLEDWWLVRDAQGHVGWLLARMVDVDVPLDIAQYAEGQRIVAAFVLDEVQDGDRKVPQYLMLLTEPKDGMPFDYNQARVFTWNVKRHRYETSYRERGLNGVLPVTVAHEEFDKEGNLPVFVLRVKDEDGKVVERKYKLNTPIVRRIITPGEQPAKAQSSRKVRRKSH
jgi:SH3-like domain-containing protein